MGVPKGEVIRIKKRLRKIRNTARELENQLRRLEWAENNAIGVGSPLLSDMPKGSPSADGRLVRAINKKLEIEQEVGRLIRVYTEERSEVFPLLDQLDHPDQRTIIKMRYVDCADWEDIVELLYAKRRDFDENRDNYYKRVMNIHGDALECMASFVVVGENH